MTTQNPLIRYRHGEVFVSYGFNTTSEMQQLLQFVGDCKKEMTELGETFKEKLEALIKGFSENIQNEELIEEGV